MDLFAERCAGIDIGKADLKACIRTPGPRGGRRSETRTFATTTAGVLALQGWLTDRQVRLVGMESTGVYWKPIFYPLEDHFECWLINPQHIKKVPGRKSDVSDAEWIARLVETGLVRASFVPPRQIRALRDLTRYRTSLLRERTREVQRLHSTLEDAGIKLAIVATDIMGKSGRDMITSLIAGQRDPHVLADLARRQMRTKIPALTEALDGRFTDHHALLCRMMLNRIDGVDATVAALDEQIAAATECFAETINRLIAIPGVARRTAEVIVAETGADMSRFPTAADLASWGRHVSRQQRVRRQTLHRPNPTRQPLASRRTGYRGSSSKPHPRDLPERALPPHRQTTRHQTRPGGRRPLDSPSQLAHHA